MDVCAVETEVTVAMNPALVAPEGTFNDAGTLTALLSLARLTAKPPLPAAALSATVQLSLAEPVIEVWLHDNEFSAGVLDPDGSPAFP